MNPADTIPDLKVVRARRILDVISASDPTQSKSHSPATTTRSNRGIELSPHVRLSKIVMRKPRRLLHPVHRNRNCKSKTSVSDGTRYRRCRKPGWYSTLRSHGQRTTITSCRHAKGGYSTRQPNSGEPSATEKD